MTAVSMTAVRGPGSSPAAASGFTKQEIEAIVEAVLERKLAKLRPEQTVLRIAELERRIGVDRSTIGRWIVAGRFPQPRYLPGSSIRVWDRAAIEAWDAEQAAAPHVKRPRGIAATKAAARAKKHRGTP